MNRRTKRTTTSKRTTLPNGIVVLSEHLPYVRSATVGIWVRAGSRHEPAHLNGISHVIEHMLFKGTTRRSAQAIAVESDQLGGQIDAFTTREYTGYAAQTLDVKFPAAFDLLADLVTAPVFDATELDRERGVILEEMKMVEDTPDELVYERFSSRFWSDHPLGRPIEGTRKTLKSFTAETVRDYHARTYTGRNLVVAAAGNITHDQVVEQTERFLGNLPPGDDDPTETAPVPTVFLENIERPCEQVHVVLGVDCPSLLSPRRQAAGLLSTLLGGGLSSRLFQKVREEAGLAYSVYADVSAFRDVGCLNVYAAVSPANLRRAVDLILAEIERLPTEGIPPDELDRAKDQHLAGLLLGLESSSSRAYHLGRQEVVLREILSLDEAVAEVTRVTAAEVQALAEEILSVREFAGIALGPVRRHHLKPIMLRRNR